MHFSSAKIAKAFFKTYWPEEKLGQSVTIVDVGGLPVLGSIKEVAPPDCVYITVDIEPHSGVDVVMEDPNKIPLPSHSADIVVCSSVFEHSTAFWVLFLECVRLLKPSGLLYINAPSNGYIHRYPIDAWRFYPDAAEALVDWADFQKVKVALLETFISRQYAEVGAEGRWNDFVAIYTTSEDSNAHPRRILDEYPELQYLPPDESATQYESQDQAIVSDLRSQLVSAESQLQALREAGRVLEADAIDLIAQLDKERQCWSSERAHWEHQLLCTYQSYSWRVTKPLRNIADTLLALPTRSKKTLMRLWLALPMSQAHRDRVKQVVFAVAFWGPGKQTRVYRDWIVYRESRKVGIEPQDSLHQAPALQKIPVWNWRESTETATQFVGRQKEFNLAKSPGDSMCIAFYLPQFHQIPENDAWWGEGFTEWTNTKSAKPLFDGHDQPKSPHPALGYYDLTDPGVIEKQIELAKSYGISAFCMYFYWFGGKRLLEAPLLIYRDSDTIDFPYFLCWANEHWTRTWDGREEDVLIAQNHSDTDDLSFIAYVATYFNDPKYFRLGGRPVLMVYKPQLLPNPERTVEIWRTYCRAQGIGEILLLFATEQDTIEGRYADFDKGVRFLPNNAQLPAITSVPDNWEGQSAGGALWDWNLLARKYGDDSVSVDHGLCETVSVGWDNSPRRGAASNIFLGDSPGVYEIWLTNALKRAKSKPHDIRLVFINAWNEWAEGAVLEPTTNKGFAYLQATRNALIELARDGDIEQSCITQELLSEIARTGRVVILHAYYLPEALELISEISSQVNKVPVLVTTPCENVLALKKHLQLSRLEFGIFKTANRGRDVLPLLNLYNLTHFFGAKHFLKLHTKRSPHRADGQDWFDQLSKPLIAAFFNAYAEISEHPAMIIAPRLFLAKLSYYLAANRPHLEALCDLFSLKLGASTFQTTRFAAGTMFIMDTNVMVRLTTHRLGAENFETETGQIDGTLAHALERFFSLLATHMAGDMGCVSLEEILEISHTSDVEFPYAEKTHL